MRRCAALLLLLGVFGPAAAARAADVLVLDGNRTTVEHDRSLPAADLEAAPAFARAPGRLSLRDPAAHAAASRNAVPAALDRLQAKGQIGASEHDARLKAYRDASDTAGRLSGQRASELSNVLDNLNEIAGGGKLTASRVGPLWTLLDANVRWWSKGNIPHPGQRVRFKKDHLLYQYFVGEGIQFHPLANFGKLNSLLDQRLRTNATGLANELLKLAADRAGGLAWEYYFHFDGSGPVWTSSLSQGTAVQAMGRAGNALHAAKYRDAAVQGLALFQAAPPEGVRIATPAGATYVQYTFTPKTRIINGFIQSLIGLFDAARVLHDQTAKDLFAAGDAEARVEVPTYDTGAWSLYDQGSESDLHYHVLLRDFLRQICRRTKAAVYCRTARRFTRYLSEPPKFALLDTAAKAKKKAKLHYTLSKISAITVSVGGGGRSTVLQSGTFRHGDHHVSWTPPKPGSYTVRFSGTDLAGNHGGTAAKLAVK